jgi:hypothetical protein
MTGLRYLERHELDDQKWNSTVGNAGNGNIYARSYMLDLMSPGWSSLVLNDYELVMPLTWRKKFGVRYLYQPPFLQQLGIYGSHSDIHASLFVETAKKHFRFAEICLNHRLADTRCEARQNFAIDLNKHYTTLAASYTDVHRKNLKRAANASLIYKSSQDHRGAIELSYGLYGKKSGVKKQAYEQLEKLAAQKPEHVMIREIWHQQECQASAFCLRDDNRIYFLLSAVTAAGKKKQANHFLVDHLIREFSESPAILDFEGSDIPGIADFYKGFGALNEPYYFCKWNHLPWPYRIFKK